MYITAIHPMPVSLSKKNCLRLIEPLHKQKSPPGTVIPEGLSREVLMTEDLFLGQSPHVNLDWLL